MELTQEQFDKTLLTIKEEINRATSGNCRVGWALKISAGQQFEKSKHNIEKIANSIIQTGEYIKEPSLQAVKDFNILKNPAYNKSTSGINQNNKADKTISTFLYWIFAIIGVIAAIATIYQIFFQTN